MVRRLSLGLIAGLMLLAGLSGAASVPSARATLGGSWTLEITSRACPRGYEGVNHAVDCVEVLAGIEFSTRYLNYGETREVLITNDEGYASVDMTGPTVEHMVDTIVPDGYSSLNATCSRNGGDQLEYKFFPSYLYIAPVAQDDVVSCVWYFVPWEPRDAFLTLRVFNCPPGMTAETLAPEACEAVTEGFDIGIGSLLGLMEPYTLADATQDGTAFRWALGPASPPGPHSDFGQWAIGESPLPVGYDSYVIIGDAVRSFERGAYHIDTSGENSHAELSLYNFASAQVEEPTEEPGEEPIEAPTQTPVVEGLPAHVHGGECDQLQIDSFVELTDLTEPEGDAEGSSQAVAVESSYSVIDISLNELLASDYSIVLHENRETHDDDLACGEVGGVRDAGGAVTVGLSEVNSSGFVGIAYLAPLPDDPTQTQVSLFAAERLAGDEQVTPGG